MPETYPYWCWQYFTAALLVLIIDISNTFSANYWYWLSTFQDYYNNPAMS